MLASFIVIMAVLVFMTVTNLDLIVASAIKKYGSEVVGTKVKVSSVKIRLKTGVGSIQGLAVVNPDGFSERNAVLIENIDINISRENITREVVIIDEIVVRKPSVLYEIGRGGDSNLAKIGRSLQKAEARSDAEYRSGKRIAIRSLIIEEGELLVQIGTLAQGSRTVATPRIELRDLGGEYGTSTGNIARQIGSAIAREAAANVPSMRNGGSMENFLGK